MHQPVRLAIVLLAILIPLSFSNAAFAAGSDGRPVWIDGTHVLERAFQTQITSLAAHPNASRRTHAVRRGVQVGQSETFWAMDVTTSQPYQTKAVLRKVGKSCYIYVEEGHELAPDVVDRLAAQFDERIYPTDRAWFGSEPTPGIDGDARITLLLLDIKDGWQPGKGYVAGYFFPLDCISADLFAQSNEREMFYLDLYPGDPSRGDFMGILAHEFQHMIHFAQDKKETKWVNEAMAQIAFFACGYGHAPQIFQYLHGTDYNLEDFQNKLENYGACYLFAYYLLTHYVGAATEAQQAFVRDLVASQKTGLDSVQDQLARHGVTKPIAEIFADWATANAAGDPSIEGGVFGYDASLKFGVNNPEQTYGFDTLPAETVKATVEPWAADYIVIVPETSWAPLKPTMTDRVKILSPKAAKVIWNVNGRELPPAKLIPQGSTVNEGERTVTTPLAADESGKFSMQIGPFIRLGVKIDMIHFQFAYDDGTQSLPKKIAVFSLPSLTDVNLKKADDRAGKLTFAFTGEKKKVVALRAVAKKTNGTTSVFPVVLDAENRGTFSLDVADDFESLTMVVIGLAGKKKSSYSYQIQRVTGREVFRKNRYEGLTAGPTGRLMGGVLSHASPAIADRARSDDEDTSHDNLGYFLNKKQELIHNLTHLMIDPAFLEGQLFKLWRLLEITRGFPHLPLPDGLAIVDFNEKNAQDLVIAWSKEFGIPVIGLPTTPAPVREGEDLTKVKDTAKRLVLAERITEFAYNNGLTLAQDFSTTLYYFARFIFSSKSTLDTIASHFTALPVVGPLASKLQKVIIGKLIRAGDNLVILISTKIRPPYSTIVPIAYSVLANVVARSLDIPLDPSEAQGYTKEYLIGTFGKYVLASVPKVGYVARGQGAVDKAAELASQLVAHGSFEEAYKKVWDDGDPSTATSIREKIAGEVSTRHEKAWKEQQIAWITAKLSEVAKLVAVIDPTSISKVAAIVLQVATAGIFAHAGYTTVSYFFRLPKGDALTGMNLAFDPKYSEPQQIAPDLMAARPDRARNARLADDLEEAFAEYLAEAQAVAESKAGASFDKLLALDEQVDDLTSRAQAIVRGSSLASDAAARRAGEPEVDALYNESQSCLIQRCALLGELFARQAGAQTGLKLSSTYKPVFDSYLRTVKSELAGVASSGDVSAPVFVDKSSAKKDGSSVVVKATIVNGSASSVPGVVVNLYTGLSATVDGGTVRSLGTIPAGGEVQVTWKMKLTETKPLPLPSVALVVDAPGINGLSKTQVLEY